MLDSFQNLLFELSIRQLRNLHEETALSENLLQTILTIRKYRKMEIYLQNLRSPQNATRH